MRVCGFIYRDSVVWQCGKWSSRKRRMGEGGREGDEEERNSRNRVPCKNCCNVMT